MQTPREPDEHEARGGCPQAEHHEGPHALLARGPATATISAVVHYRPAVASAALLPACAPPGAPPGAALPGRPDACGRLAGAPPIVSSDTIAPWLAAPTALRSR
jgi:hypothetical protein